MPVSCAAELPVPGAAGVYDSRNRTIILSDGTCLRLELLRRHRYSSREQRQWEQAQAAFVLAHEAGHAAGLEQEAAADRYACRRLGYVLRRLGVGKAYARLLGSYAAPYCETRR